MIKHTQAPWQVGATTTLNGEAVSEIMSGDDTIAMSMNYSEADARLIAAAPELLEALKFAVRQNSHDMLMTGEELRKCEEAIAKAEGTA